MRLPTKTIIIVLAVTISLVIIGVLVKSREVQISKKYKKETMENYKFIKDIEIYGNSPALFITHKLSREVSLVDIEEVFEAAKKYFLSEGVFTDLKNMHHEKYGGTLSHIDIDFDYSKKDEKIDYIFSSFGSFKTWYIEYNGETKEYKPAKK